MNDRIETLLEDAGRRWRDGQAPPPAVDRSRWAAPAVPERRRWAPVLAVAAATALVAATTSVVLTSGGGRPAPRTDHVQLAPSARSTTSSSTGAELVLRDGDLAEATGEVRAGPGRPVQLCSPVNTTALVRTSGDRPCLGVQVAGVDLERLGRPGTGGIRVGRFTLRGIWRSGVLHVTEQTAPRTPPSRSFPLPCSEPPGGWRPNGTPDDDSPFFNYIEKVRPDRFGFPYTARVGNGPDAREVAVVRVVAGDVEQTVRDLRQRFTSNVCLVDAPGTMSIAEELRQRVVAAAALEPLLQDRDAHISSIGFSDTVDVDLLILTPELYARLVAAVPDHVRPDPWLRPVRS